MTGDGLKETLPKSYYLSDETFVREREGIFFTEWFCVGRAAELISSGDFLHVAVVGESVLVVRGKEDRLTGFYNVCRHRGCRLTLDEATSPGDRLGPSGRFASAIRCPYHSWTYGLDGRLRSARLVSDICKEDFSLHPVGVRTWGGFVFVSLSPDSAPAFDAQLGDVPAKLQRYPLDRLQPVTRISYDVAANWKVVMENYNECYHCGPVHPELCELVPAFKEAGGGDLDWDDGIPHREGAWTFTRSGSSRRAPFRGLSEEERTRHKGELLYPNLMLSLSADHVTAFTLWPNSPGSTTIVCDFLFDRDEIATEHFDPSDAVEFWDLINKQDWGICEAVQRGMRSRVFTSGFFAPMEDASKDIRRYVEERLK